MTLTAVSALEKNLQVLGALLCEGLANPLSSRMVATHDLGLCTSL